MGYNKNRRKAKDEGQLPNRTKTFPHVPNGLTQENREDKEINGIKNYPANTGNESLEFYTPHVVRSRSAALAFVAFLTAQSRQQAVV